MDEDHYHINDLYENNRIIITVRDDELKRPTL